MITRESLSVHF